MEYTVKVLPLARKFHDGHYRKDDMDINGKKYQIPYVLHCIKVYSTLNSLTLPLSREEDILLALAILHDVIEEGSSCMPKGGVELTEIYGFPEEVYTIFRC